MLSTKKFYLSRTNWNISVYADDRRHYPVKTLHMESLVVIVKMQTEQGSTLLFAVKEGMLFYTIWTLGRQRTLYQQVKTCD